MSTGHSGRDSTLAFLRKRVSWKNMKTEVAKFIEQCSVCNEYMNKKIDWQKFRSVLSGPFTKVGIDIIGPLKVDSKKMK